MRTTKKTFYRLCIPVLATILSITAYSGFIDYRNISRERAISEELSEAKNAATTTTHFLNLKKSTCRILIPAFETSFSFYSIHINIYDQIVKAENKKKGKKKKKTKRKRIIKTYPANYLKNNNPYTHTA